MDGIADYVFERDLGQGNHGWFYLARRPSRLPVPDEFVAVKVLNASPTTDGYRRAVRELRAFAAISSPYLVRLYDAGQDDGVVYYAMEHHPLGSLAAPGSSLGRRERLRAVSHAAVAAHAMHEVGMVHRDIKPGNVLLRPDGARLSDLGLAHVLAPGQTVTSMGSLTSLEFIDPAVLAGGRVARSSDVWSLGATLHRVLTGRGLYPNLPEDDPIAALRACQKDRPVIDESLVPDEAAIVRRALNPDQARRYPTAADLAADLDQVIDSAQFA
jgi:eukaryotic-like serine/threonine-protein kinase